MVVGCPDVLGGKHPDGGHREVLVLGLTQGRAVAQGVRLPADGALVQLDYASAAEPVPYLSAAAAKVISEKHGLEAQVARFPRPWG